MQSFIQLHRHLNHVTFMSVFLTRALTYSTPLTPRYHQVPWCPMLYSRTMVSLPCMATSWRFSILPLIADRYPSAISPSATTASLVSFRVHCSPSHSMVRSSAVVIVLARRREHLQFASVRNLYSSRLQQSSLVAISPRVISKSVADYSGSLPISAPTHGSLTMLSCWTLQINFKGFGFHLLHIKKVFCMGENSSYYMRWQSDSYGRTNSLNLCGNYGWLHFGRGLTALSWLGGFVFCVGASPRRGGAFIY